MKTKRCFGSVIDKRQIAFLEGRNLLLGVLVANELVDKARRREKKCLVFKVDYEKAYVSVSWDFLLYIIHKLGFGEKWLGWIKQCWLQLRFSSW